jgi:Ca2+-binding EF-hand superfamily protein
MSAGDASVLVFLLLVAFQIYDVDEDGLISSQELYHTLQGLVGVHYTEAQLEQVGVIFLKTNCEFYESLYERFNNVKTDTSIVLPN